MRLRCIALFCLAILASAAAAEPVRAREWFVRAGSEGGDGSPAKPDIQPGDILLVSRLAYPAGYTIVISDDSKVLATRVF